MTFSRILAKYLDLWGRTFTFQMWPWCVRITNRLRHNMSFWHLQVHSSQICWWITNMHITWSHKWLIVCFRGQTFPFYSPKDSPDGPGSEMHPNSDHISRICPKSSQNTKIGCRRRLCFGNCYVNHFGILPTLWNIIFWACSPKQKSNNKKAGCSQWHRMTAPSKNHHTWPGKSPKVFGLAGLTVV